MEINSLHGLEEGVFESIIREYADRWRVHLQAISGDGAIVRSGGAYSGCLPDCHDARLLAIREGWRWGEPAVSMCMHNHLLWSVPIMYNEKVLGGLVASVAEEDIFAEEDGTTRIDVRTACHELRLIAERYNLTNASALALRRQESANEQQRAYAIHDFKKRGHDSMREIYLREEPAILAALKRGDRKEAHQALERILVEVRHHADGNVEGIKSYLMELAVVMCRTAIDSGGAPKDMLGFTYTNLNGLTKLSTADDLATWLWCMMDHLLNAIESNRMKDPGAMLTKAVTFIKSHAHEHISRDEVAKTVGISPSHFSYLIHKESGATFTDLLNQIRIDLAAEMLVSGCMALSEVADASGFRDQSYFTKVFKKYRHQTPKEYRRQFASGFTS